MDRATRPSPLPADLAGSQGAVPDPSLCRHPDDYRRAERVRLPLRVPPDARSLIEACAAASRAIGTR